jgi:hypothetical protein
MGILMKEAVIINIPFDNRKEKYTYADYLNWPDGERWEIISGEPYMMGPAPSSEHQRILMEIASQLHTYLRGKSCTVFPAPFDVRLPRGEEDDEEIENVVQPNLNRIYTAGIVFDHAYHFFIPRKSNAHLFPSCLHGSKSNCQTRTFMSVKLYCFCPIESVHKLYFLLNKLIISCNISC